MTNAPFALDRREFIALAGGLAAVLVVGDGAYFSSRRSAAHAQPVPSESGTLTQPETPLNGTIASPNTETAAALGIDYSVFNDMGTVVEVQTTED